MESPQPAPASSEPQTNTPKTSAIDPKKSKIGAAKTILLLTLFIAAAVAVAVLGARYLNQNNSEAEMQEATSENGREGDVAECEGLVTYSSEYFDRLEIVYDDCIWTLNPQEDVQLGGTIDDLKAEFTYILTDNDDNTLEIGLNTVFGGVGFPGTPICYVGDSMQVNNVFGRVTRSNSLINYGANIVSKEAPNFQAYVEEFKEFSELNQGEESSQYSAGTNYDYCELSTPALATNTNFSCSDSVADQSICDQLGEFEDGYHSFGHIQLEGSSITDAVIENADSVVRRSSF